MSILYQKTPLCGEAASCCEETPAKNTAWSSYATAVSYESTFRRTFSGFADASRGHCLLKFFGTLRVAGLWQP